MTDEIRAAIAQRMNRLDEIGVVWDRCVLLSDSGVVYGWIARDDGRADYVIVNVQWGSLPGLDGDDVDYLAVGCSTSSALHSARISKLLVGPDVSHTDCTRVEDVFGDLVNRKVTA